MCRPMFVIPSEAEESTVELFLKKKSEVGPSATVGTTGLELKMLYYHTI
jgi:hypothetical protein